MTRLLQKNRVLLFAVGILAIASILVIQQSRINSLQQDLSSARQSIEDLEFGGERLLALAHRHLDADDREEAEATARLLIERHPHAREAVTVQAVFDSVSARNAADELRREAAEAERSAALQAKQERRQQALASLRRNRDDIANMNWYYSSSTPTTLSSNSIHLYISQAENGRPGEPRLRMRIQYVASNWLFIEEYVLTADDQRHTIRPGYNQVERNSSGRGIREWYDWSPSPADLAMVRAIIESETSVIRHRGSQFRDDRTITQRERRAFQEVLDAYEALREG